MVEVWRRPMTVHIGYHKTATTFLQRAIFSQAASFSMPWTIADLDELIVRPAPFVFDLDSVRAELDHRVVSDREPLVVSHEDLVGHPFNGGVGAPEIAARLCDLFPDMRVLVVVREQAAMLVSIYKQYVRGGGALSIERFVNPLPNERRNPSFTLDHYLYDRLVAHYQEKLGHDRVRVIPFELLRADADAFLTEVCSVVGVRQQPVIPEKAINVGTSAFGIRLKRPLNRLFVRDALNPSPLFSAEALVSPIDAAVRRIDRIVPGPLVRRSERQLSEVAGRLVGTRFAESNRALAAITGLDLAGYGYAMPGVEDG